MLIPGAHQAAEGVYEQEVYVETLLDGPVVGFAAVQTPAQVELWIDMSAHAVEVVPAIELLNPEYHYVGRLLRDPMRIVLTDVATTKGLLSHEAKFVEADRLGMECIQLLHAGGLESAEQLRGFLEQSPAGIVIKPVKVRPQQRVLHVEVTPDMFMDAPSAGHLNEGSPAAAEEPCQTSNSVN